MSTVDLDYLPGSLLPRCRRDQISRFEAYCTRCLERTIRFPSAYRQHVLRWHGGAPKRCRFRTKKRRTRTVGRFMNFLREEDLTLPIIPSWRDGASKSNPRPAEDIRLEYSIWRNCFSGAGVDVRIHPELIGFAGIDTAGHSCREMAEFDLLCFDFRERTSPSVVTWSYHESLYDPPEEHQVIERVAESFEEFLNLLTYPRDRGAAAEAIECF